MLQSYKFSDFIEPARDNEKPDWIDLAAPEEKELEETVERHGIPPWLLTAPLDPKERPRIDQDGEAILIVVRLPVEEQEEGGPFLHTVPVGLVICPNLIVTVCRRKSLVTDSLSRLFQRRRSWSRVRLLFALFQCAGTSFINKLEKLEEQAGEAEARLRRSPENEELLALLNIEKALIDITLALKSNHALMEKFRHSNPFGPEFTQDEIDILDDAVTENQQAIFMAEIFSQVLGSMSDAFGSIISNNLNKTMKFLAGVTIVLMLPTIIAGLYGMNVSLPWAERPDAFRLLGVLCLALMLLVSILFAKKKWF